MKKLFLATATSIMLATVSAHAAPPQLGEPAPVTDAVRTVPIMPTTRSVSITHGETVRFVSGAQEFAYRFNGAKTTATFDLRSVAPAGMIDHEVTARVQPNVKDKGEAGESSGR